MEDQKVSESFTLYDLTQTSRTNLQEQNRLVNDQQIQTLRNLAGLLEATQEIIMARIKVQSAYRCLALNKAVGSSERSQHLLAEAADFLTAGVDLNEAFRTLWRAVREGKLNVGQLIHETAARDYGAVSWIHVSLGAPWRAADRCNQVLRMEHGVYTLLGSI